MQTLTGAVASVFLYIILGKTVTEIAIALHNRIGQGVKECHRFVCTEIMHYLNDTALLQYKDADVEYVQVWTILDERTCETYGSYCERVYTIDKCPRVPLHANCRCTVLPVVDEKNKVREQRNKVENSNEFVYNTRKEEELTLVAADIKEQIKKYANASSKWSGKINVAQVLDNAIGIKEWSCDISLLNSADDGVIWHEMLHSCSVSYFTPNEYMEHQAIEEASVEFLKQQICMEKGIVSISAYENEVSVLKLLNDRFGYGSNIEFAKELFNVPMPNRYQWLEDKVDDSLKNLGATFEEYYEVIDFIKILKGEIQ